MSFSWRRPFQLLATATNGFIDHDDLTLAASIAYYTALSLAPMLILALWIASAVSPQAQDQLVAQIGQLAGEQAQTAIKLIIDSAAAKPASGRVAGIGGLIVLLFSATAVFSQLQAALNVIWAHEVPPHAGGNALLAWARRRFLSIGILGAMVFVLIVSLAVSAVLKIFLSQDDVFWNVVNEIVTGAVFTCLFAALFKFLPDAHLTWRATWAGALVTALLFVVGKFSIGLYLASSGIGDAYGPAGSMVLLLVWVFYSAAIFLFGAEIVQARSAQVDPGAGAKAAPLPASVPPAKAQ